MKKWLVGLIGTLFALLATMADAQYATLTGQFSASNGLPAVNFTMAFTPTQWGFIAGTGVQIQTTTYCATSADGSVVGITNPLVRTINTAAYSGGTLPAGNYFVVYTWYTATATVTLPSPESTAQLTAQGNLQVAPPAGPLPAGVLGMNVYIGTTSGGETYQGQTVGTNVYTQSTALASGSSPPVTNNTVCKQVANDAIWPVGTGYTVSLTDPNGNTQPGYPMVWQLLGPNTTINLSNGLPYYHGVVTYPVPILASPLNHATQSISGGLSIGGYYMSAGGYKVNGNAGTVGYCLGSDGSAYDTSILCGNHYQTIQSAGTAQPQESILNFLNTFTVTDDPSNHRTNVAVNIQKTQISLPSTSVAGNTCSTPATASLSGVTSTSTFSTSFATSPVAATGWGANGGLVLELWPDASPNVLDWSICNQTSGSITPTAITLNVGVN
jgi:hypothetical protein